MNNKEKGDKGEAVAAKYLIREGYSIIEKNYRVPFGEVDIIAKKDGVLVFVEVKFRQDSCSGYPREAVTAKKQRTIRKAALYYIASLGYEPDICFDVIEIIGDKLEHLRNAF